MAESALEWLERVVEQQQLAGCLTQGSVINFLDTAESYLLNASLKIQSVYPTSTISATKNQIEPPTVSPSVALGLLQPRLAYCAQQQGLAAPLWPLFRYELL